MKGNMPCGKALPWTAEGEGFESRFFLIVSHARAALINNLVYLRVERAGLIFMNLGFDFPSRNAQIPALPLSLQLPKECPAVTFFALGQSPAAGLARGLFLSVTAGKSWLCCSEIRKQMREW